MAWIALALAAAILALALGWLWGRGRERLARELAQQALEHERDRLDEACGARDALEQRLRQTEQQAGEWRTRCATLAQELKDARTREAEGQRWQSQLEGTLGRQFRELAAQVLEQRSAAAAAQQDARLSDLLGPLRTQLAEFGSQVQAARTEQAQRGGALQQQLSELKHLHATLSVEAVELTRALKGNQRLQGHFGELVLERLLSASGLREGQEYRLQAVLSAEDGSRPRPDVLVQLPGGRVLVIDAKCSLRAYLRSQEAQDPATRNRERSAHVTALRAHVTELSSRDYAGVLGADALELVLLFVPVEAAFLDALDHDPALIEDALEQRIVLVTPATLLLALRTCAELWRHQQRDRNAGLIADRAGRLHDKFAGFVEDLAKVDEQLRRSLRALESAQLKLSSGPGNLLRQVGQLRELGARVTKSLPEGEGQA